MRTRLALLVACLLALAPTAWAGPSTGPRTLAVQNRLHTQKHELTLGVGVLPLDAFTKGLTGSVGYTHHFNDLLAWEIAQVAYSVGIDTHLKEDLENLAQPVGPTPFETVSFFATSNLVFKPLYGKLVLLNRQLIHQELYLLAGGGYGRLTITHRPAIDLGVGARVYAGKHLSFRLDVRDYLFLASEDLHQELWLNLGASLSFGGGGSR